MLLHSPYWMEGQSCVLTLNHIICQWRWPADAALSHSWAFGLVCWRLTILFPEGHTTTPSVFCALSIEQCSISTIKPSGIWIRMAMPSSSRCSMPVSLPGPCKINQVKKYLNGLSVLPIAMRSQPQSNTLCCSTARISNTVSSWDMLRWTNLCHPHTVLPQDVDWSWRWEQRSVNHVPWPCAPKGLQCLSCTTPLVWPHCSDIVLSFLSLSWSQQNQFSLQRTSAKKFISWIASSMTFTTVPSTPKAWKIREAIVCATLS